MDITVTVDTSEFAYKILHEAQKTVTFQYKASTEKLLSMIKEDWRWTAEYLFNDCIENRYWFQKIKTDKDYHNSLKNDLKVLSLFKVLKQNIDNIFQDDPTLLTHLFKLFDERKYFIDVEEKIKLLPNKLYDYIYNVIKQRIEEFEPYLISSEIYSKDYANTVCKDPLVYVEMIIKHRPDKINTLKNIPKKFIKKYNLDKIIEVKDAGVEL